MPDSFNPFASPATDAEFRPDGLSDSVLSPRQRRQMQVGEVVVAWEWRRLWYNLVLTAACLPIVATGLVAGNVDPDEVTMLIPAAIFANACFLAGPLIEGYWTWLLGPARWMRNLLFWAGTALATVLAIATCWMMVSA
ncbi:hypothetical protein Pla123a_41540 [Posidoniimonas polymericola]|uniref:Uncharacterized protein n=1 Tax=Posidoniimonas polymericola TaxID=2528002 RepID=A0A5C5XY35_9BACT|nr:hypothetical protein [Posidoniimonas polymericola]TWT67598.1 hypothetical protein Pla123a_41540 [Posidoniimonas polymericola]